MGGDAADGGDIQRHFIDQPKGSHQNKSAQIFGENSQLGLTPPPSPLKWNSDIFEFENILVAAHPTPSDRHFSQIFAQIYFDGFYF